MQYAPLQAKNNNLNENIWKIKTKNYSFFIWNKYSNSNPNNLKFKLSKKSKYINIYNNKIINSIYYKHLSSYEDTFNY